MKGSARKTFLSVFATAPSRDARAPPPGNMPVLLKTVMENHLDTAMVSIVTDDLHTVDLQRRGHLDDALRTLGMRLDFVKAIQMVTVNCARAFNLDCEIRRSLPAAADINITTGAERFPRADHVCRRPPDHR